jgi:Ca-activated chloride channel family protein
MSRYFNILIWEYQFYQPHMLWLLLFVPVILFFWFLMQRRSNGQLKFSRDEKEQMHLTHGYVRYYRWGINTLVGLSLSMLIITLAEPYHEALDPPKIDYKNGIDIVLSIDASTSMLSQDFDPNRLEVAKKVAQKFVDQRKGDRIGLVVYEGEAYTACPATLDYKILKEQIGKIEPGYLEPGTAVGNGLGVAVTRLRSDSLKSKVIILLTDGSNNAGSIDPIEAAELAKAKNIKVYTIGIGTTGLAPQPVQTPFGIQYINAPVEIDEVTLKKIAEVTNGKYFRAKDEDGLKSIYAEINRMEKRKMEDQHFGAAPPLTLFPFYIWSLLFILVAWGIQRWKFRLDD